MFHVSKVVKPMKIRTMTYKPVLDSKTNNVSSEDKNPNMRILTSTSRILRTNWTAYFQKHR